MEEEKINVRCRTIIEMLGKPKEHVENTIKQYVDKIKEDNNIAVLEESFSIIKEQGEFFSKFVELEMVVKGIPNLIGFCFDYMPSSIEIIKPDEFRLKNKIIADFLNDLQARLHKVDMVVKQLKNENDFVKRNMSTLVRNVILISLTKNKLDSEKIAKIVGISQKEIMPFLDKLVKDNKIKKEDNVYSLV